MTPDEMNAPAAAMIQAVLNGDMWTFEKISARLDEDGASWPQFAFNLANLSAFILSQAYGGEIQASGVMDHWIQVFVMKQTRKAALQLAFRFVLRCPRVRIVLRLGGLRLDLSIGLR
jgi:hypothetical protein